MPTPLDMAHTVLGKTEGADRAALMDYLKTGGANLDPATVAWCAAFVNSSLQQGGYSGTGSNMARSFLQWGDAVDPAKLQPGDIGVFPRGDPNGPYGHVGFVEAVDPNTGMVTLLGGNQGDAVSSKQYAMNNALGWRRANDAAKKTPSGPVEAAGGGAGSEATETPYTAPALTGGAAPALAATAKAEDADKPKNWWELLGGGVAAGAKAAGGGKFSYNVPTQPGPARVDVAPAPITDPQQAEMRRQQLAMVMQRLNQGSLW